MWWITRPRSRRSLVTEAAACTCFVHWSWIDSHPDKYERASVVERLRITREFPRGACPVHGFECRLMTPSEWAEIESAR